jgi:hypothetical protein
VKYSRLEDLPVWKATIEFALKVFESTNTADFRGFGDTKSPLERAAVSISNNVGEGFDRGANKELIYFLYFKGLGGGMSLDVRLCEADRRFSNFKCEILNLITLAENISRQLHGWLGH